MGNSVRPVTEIGRERKTSPFPESETVDLVIDKTANTDIKNDRLLGRVI